MNPLIETMYVLQRCAQTNARVAEASPSSITELRARVPAPVLAHFDRLVALGRKGVAEVRNGICSACHLRLPAATTAPGSNHDDLQLCENCGAYLIFPPAEEAVVAPVAPRRHRRRHQAVAVA